jgi:hypothetical protein
MAGKLLGRLEWGMNRSESGEREYDIKWLVEVTRDEDGPGIVALTPGLPAIGSTWSFGKDNDPFVWCRPDLTIRRAHTPNERGNYWTVEQKFSNKKFTAPRCADNQIEDPILEPPRISGSFVKATKVAMGKSRYGVVTLDANGDEVDFLGVSEKPIAIRTTSFEPITGKALEFDDSRPTVNIELNTLILPLALYTRLVDAVNDAPMWGVGERTIKLSNVSWKRQLYGTCTFYYVIGYEFEINFKTWDRLIASQGHKCLKGWSPGYYVKNPSPPPELIPPDWKLDPEAIDLSTGNPNFFNPNNYEVYKDANQENTTCFHDVFGRPTDDFADQAYIKVRYYDEENFLALGVPASLT